MKLFASSFIDPEAFRRTLNCCLDQNTANNFCKHSTPIHAKLLWVNCHSRLESVLYVPEIITRKQFQDRLRQEIQKSFLKSSYQIYLFCIEIFRQKCCPCQNFTAFVLWNQVKLCANQQQRHWVLSKLLSVIVPARKTTQIVHSNTFTSFWKIIMHYRNKPYQEPALVCCLTRWTQ